MATLREIESKLKLAGVSLSRQIYKNCVIDTFSVGANRWKASIKTPDGVQEELPEITDSNASAFKAAKAFIDEMEG